MKVMLVDDHKLFTEGMQYLLQTYGIQVIGTAKNGTEAVTKAHVLKPDIILMDIRMPECGGIDALKLIKADMPDIKVIMLTTSEMDEDLFNAVKYGASGYLFKNMEAKELIEMLSQVESGFIPMSPGLAARLLKEYQNDSGNSIEGVKKCSEEPLEYQLTDRQIEILVMISSGKTYKEAGETLGLKERTVKYHMSQIIDKLHLENRAQVIAYAAQKGLIEGNGEFNS